MRPGAVDHARWMPSILYPAKVFALSSKEIKRLAHSGISLKLRLGQLWYIVENEFFGVETQKSGLDTSIASIASVHTAIQRRWPNVFVLPNLNSCIIIVMMDVRDLASPLVRPVATNNRPTWTHPHRACHRSENDNWACYTFVIVSDF